MAHVVCNSCGLLTGILIEVKEKDDESYLVCTKCGNETKIEPSGKVCYLYHPDYTDTDDS